MKGIREPIRRLIVKKFAFVILVLMVTTVLIAHPHFAKSITVDLPSGVKASISYRTTPSNEEHAQNVQVGTFVTPRGPSLSLSGEITAGSVTIPAGEYTIGVIKNSANDWTLALYPGRVERGAAPDMSKVIKLDSMFTSSGSNAAHLVVDVQPGHGRLAGKSVLNLQFGSLALDGALS